MKHIKYIFDGAFGTYYQQKTNDVEACEYANRSHPEVVCDIHKEYIDAGVNAIKTNTFSLNSHLVEDETLRNEYITLAVEHAKRAVGDYDISIFADIGYIKKDEGSEYESIVKQFIACGITNFLFETMPSFEYLKGSIQYIRNHVKDSVIISSFTCNEDGYTSLGKKYNKLLEEAKDVCDYVGLNCMSGPSHMYRLLKDIPFDTYQLSAMPNVGYPTMINQRLQYHDNAAYFSDALLKLCALGVQVIGGCCGSTPSHMRVVVEKLNSEDIKYEYYETKTAKDHAEKAFPLLEVMKKRKLLAVEIEPPSNANIQYFIEFATLYKQKGADYLTVVDSPHAKPCADSLMMASKIKREVGIDVIAHVTCRDKNSIAIKGSLLAAYMDEVSDVLALRGDMISKTERYEHKAVFNFNAYDLISYMNELNKDIFIERPFCIGGALNINAPAFEGELKRAHKKEEQGVHYFITQSIFEEQAIVNLKQARKELKVPIIVGFYPVVSYRNAVFLNNEISGITIPADFLEILKQANPEEYKQISLTYMKHLIDEVYEYCDGFYLTTPLKKTDFICELIDYIKEKE